MSKAALVRTLVALLVLALLGWVIHNTRWVEVEVEDPARGVAATDEYYSLRHVLAAAGATLEVRTTLAQLPPADATLLLESDLWDIFPERDAQLKTWVEHGGHLVVLSPHSNVDDEGLRWVPLTSIDPRRRPARAGAKGAPAPASAASTADDDPHGARKRAPSPEGETERQRRAREGVGRMLGLKLPEQPCLDFTEDADTREPAFDPGRVYRGCMAAGRLHALGHVEPTWSLAGKGHTLAMRVPVGHGTVTGVAPGLVIDNHDLLRKDNGLIAVAVLQAVPGRAVWILEDEAREPLLEWMWHEARTPFLLALAAIGLALWRLMVRFGPREAVPPQARRSMGEQVRGTGQFIAGSDPRALHAATREAFEAVARRRVEGWAGLDDGARIEALATTLPQPYAIDRTALRASMNIGSGATPPQILAATAVLEQARRALLLAPAAAPPN